MDPCSFTLFIFLNIVIVHLTARAARRRGRSVKAWMWLGVIFGPLAWLTVALLPAKRTTA
jgi:hypothetical protein